ncbi:MAG: DMT family transporter [Firmicutes bacterium]|nr:DMT family transporter [Bacillota bacterium]
MNNKTKGIFFIIFSAFSFALMNTFVKMAGDLPSFQKSFFRNLVALFFAVIMLMKDKEKFKLRKENLPVLILRSVLGTIGILCNYYAVDRLILSDASMLGKLAPFFTIVFSYIFLKEKMNLIQALAVISAFIGSLFIIKPSGTMDSFPALIGLIGAMGAGSAYTAVRYLGTKKERSAYIIFFFSAFSTVVIAPYLIFNYHEMSLYQFGMLMLAGLAASGGQIGVTNAYKYAAAKEISIFDDTQVLFAALIGLVFFEQIPDSVSLIGYAIIIGVSVIMFIYNKRTK